MEEKLEWSELQNILNIVVALLLVTGKLEAHTMSIAPASGRSGFFGLPFIPRITLKLPDMRGQETNPSITVSFTID
jgi:hypothetical protein